jgi:hypothetical protein
VAADIAAGIPGLALQAGDHVCAFYRGPEGRDEVLLPFLRAGLLAGDKCLAVLDEADPDEVTRRLADVIDLDAGPDGHQLEVLTSAESYLLGGAFSSPEMLSFWNLRVGSSIGQQGYHFARSLGEMTWALRDLPGVEDLVSYEAELNEFLPQYPQVILCLYDLDRFDGGLVVDLLRTHPKIVMCGTVMDNPYYTEPTAFLAARRR